MGIFNFIVGGLLDALDESAEQYRRHKQEREGKKEEYRESEPPLPVGWEEKHTKRYDMLVNTESEDGAHFSFSPYRRDLHATTDTDKGKDKIRIPIATGLPALNLYNDLKTGGYGGLELTTKLRGYESTEKEANQLLR